MKPPPAQSSDRLKLEWIPGRFAICRLNAGDPLPSWADLVGGGTRAHSQECEKENPARRDRRAALLSLTRTDRELSVVIDESLVPEHVQAQRGFVALRIAGVLDFALVGVLSKLTETLAEARIPALAISTYDTDILLIGRNNARAAVTALQKVAQCDDPP